MLGYTGMGLGGGDCPSWASAALISILTSLPIADLRDHKCNRPNVVGKDEDYCS